jgi:glycerol-3-phosphate acyltransferase PlsY
MSWLVFAAMILMSYIIGSLPFGVWIGLIFKHKDIRDEGSGGTGTANAVRSLGFVLGAVTLLLDILKGYLPLYISNSFYPYHWQIVIIGISAIIGHTYSLILLIIDRLSGNSKKPGGKGVATTCGVIMYMDLRIAILGFFVWVATTIITKYSSLGSLISVWFSFALGIYFRVNLSYTIFLFIIALLITYNHRKNIKNHIEGKELKFENKK